jgi:hypothetical protein
VTRLAIIQHFEAPTSGFAEVTTMFVAYAIRPMERLRSVVTS